MGMFDSLPRGSQVKLWDCMMVTKKVGDNVLAFGMPKYIVLLREGGYVKVEDGIITKIVENHRRKFYTPEDFPTIPCLDKWGDRVVNKDALKGIGILGESYYWKRRKKENKNETKR